jgi:hypothetical protein
MDIKMLLLYHGSTLRTKTYCFHSVKRTLSTFHSNYSPLYTMLKFLERHGLYELLSLLLAWQNYCILIGWEEYNYFIYCTAVQLMIFLTQTKWRKGILNRSVKWNCRGGTKWKYKPKHQMLVESLAGLGFGERIWCWHREVSNFVMLIINK